MKKNSHSYEDLKEHANTLSELLDDPRPIHFGWIKACAEQVKAISEYRKHFKGKK
jgi:hypothetical protein